jgi:hypothetical protein
LIVGVSSIRNEADIIAKTVTHTLAVGADHVIVSDGYSSDDTFDILSSLDNVTALRQDGPFVQPDEMMRLNLLAKEMGADWVVPFDADEFWTDLEGLNDLGDEVGKVEATVFGHRDWDHRYERPRIQGKVAFRSAMDIAWGNHSATTPGIMVGGFAIRELQYQSFDHFLAKIEKSRELFETSSFSEAYGSHMRTLVRMTDEQREFEWERLMAEPAVFDPIPYRGAR